jgi:hypothetical protein
MTQSIGEISVGSATALESVQGLLPARVLGRSLPERMLIGAACGFDGSS